VVNKDVLLSLQQIGYVQNEFLFGLILSNNNTAAKVSYLGLLGSCQR
jgi:hypothetical protein